MRPSGSAESGLHSRLRPISRACRSYAATWRSLGPRRWPRTPINAPAAA